MTRTSLAAAVLGFGLVAAGRSQADTQKMGGSSDGPLIPGGSACPIRLYLAGLDVFSSPQISNVRPFCGAMEPDGGWSGVPAVVFDQVMAGGSTTGGIGEGQLQLFCPRDFWVDGYKGYTQVYGINAVTQLTLTCRNLKTGATTSVATRLRSGIAQVEWPASSCDQSSVAIGVYGTTHDERVIQFGLGCSTTQPALREARILGAARLMPTPIPVKALGRVNLPPGTALAAPRPICEVAAEARARNNAAAPGLEAQCRAATKAAADKAEAERKAVGVVALKDDHAAARYAIGTPTQVPRPQYPPYGAAYSSSALPASLKVNQTTFVAVKMKNASSQTWPAGGLFRLAYHWNRRGAEPIWDGARTFMPTAVAPGASVTLNAKVIAPPTAGSWALTWDMVQENVAWFSDKGVAMGTPQNLTVTP